MINSKVSAILKDLCKENKVTLSKLLEDCNLSKSLIYDLEKRNAIPSVDKIERIADYFNCSVDYLLGRTNNPEINSDILETFDLYYSEYKVSAGTGSSLGDRIDSGYRLRLDYDIYGNADEAIKITGDSMEPNYKNGQIIAIKHKPVINNGEIGIFVLNGEGYIKKLHKDGVKITLDSLNDKYPPIHIKPTDDLIIIGKVIATIPETDIIEYISVNK